MASLNPSSSNSRPSGGSSSGGLKRRSVGGSSPGQTSVSAPSSNVNSLGLRFYNDDSQGTLKLYVFPFSFKETFSF